MEDVGVGDVGEGVGGHHRQRGGDEDGHGHHEGGKSSFAVGGRHAASPPACLRVPIGCRLPGDRITPIGLLSRTYRHDVGRDGCRGSEFRGAVRDAGDIGCRTDCEPEGAPCPRRSRTCSARTAPSPRRPSSPPRRTPNRVSMRRRQPIRSDTGRPKRWRGSPGSRSRRWGWTTPIPPSTSGSRTVSSTSPTTVWIATSPTMATRSPTTGWANPVTPAPSPTPTCTGRCAGSPTASARWASTRAIGSPSTWEWCRNCPSPCSPAPAWGSSTRWCSGASHPTPSPVASTTPPPTSSSPRTGRGEAARWCR